MKPKNLRTVDLGHGVAVMVDSVNAGSSNEATLAGDDERVRAPQTSPRRCPEDQGMHDPCIKFWSVTWCPCTVFDGEIPFCGGRIYLTLLG